MGFLDRLRRVFGGEKKDLEALGEVEGLALVEALLMTVHVDGEVTDEEMAQLTQALGQLPLSFCADAAARQQVVEKTRQKILADRHLSTDEFARGIAGRVTSPGTRRQILTLAAQLAAVDGIDYTEALFLNSLARAFDIDDAEVAKLMEEAAART
jgi:uncharacterized membrane protein YebE (DUF533 family)